jgi:hypothetical protein
MAHQRLQLLPRWVRGCPGGRPLGATKLGDEMGIQLIGLVAAQLTFGITTDTRRVDDADCIALLMHRVFSEECGNGSKVKESKEGNHKP